MCKIGSCAVTLIGGVLISGHGVAADYLHECVSRNIPDRAMVHARHIVRHPTVASQLSVARRGFGGPSIRGSVKALFKWHRCLPIHYGYCSEHRIRSVRAKCYVDRRGSKIQSQNTVYCFGHLLTSRLTGSSAHDVV